MVESHMLAGQCYCGGVRYRVADLFQYALNCHCSGCRRATGSAFKPFAGIGVHHLTVTQGEVQIYGDALCHDAHCPTCGSLLYSLVRDATFVHVALGTLTDTPGIRPTAHIFVASKAPWYEITDDLPQYEGHIP